MAKCSKTMDRRQRSSCCRAGCSSKVWCTSTVAYDGWSWWPVDSHRSDMAPWAHGETCRWARLIWTQYTVKLVTTGVASTLVHMWCGRISWCQLWAALVPRDSPTDRHFRHWRIKISTGETAWHAFRRISSLVTKMPKVKVVNRTASAFCI